MFPIDLHYYIRDVFLWEEIWHKINKYHNLEMWNILGHIFRGKHFAKIIHKTYLLNVLYHYTLVT